MLFFANARFTVITSTSSSSTSRMLITRSSMVFLPRTAIGRPGEPEGRTRAGHGLDPGASTPRLDDLAHHREPDTGALHLVPRFEGLEQTPDALVKLGSHADAIVLDEDGPRVVFLTCADLDVDLA